MPRFTPPTTEAIFAQMLARVVVMGGLTDVTNSSVIKHFLLAYARALDEGYYQASLINTAFSIDSCVGADLDARAADIAPGLLTRLGAQSAKTTLVFSRSTSAGTLIIPQGTQASTSSGILFTTTQDGSIGPDNPAQVTGNTIGEDSAPIPATANTPGAAGNVSAGTLTVFVQKPTGVDTVTNLTPGLQGADVESDDAFRARLKAYVSSLARSTISALEACVLSATDATTGDTVLFSSAVEDPILPGRVYLYVDDGTGAATSTATVTGENVTAGLSGPPVNSAVGGEQTLSLDNGAIKTDALFALVSSSRGNLTQNTQYTVNVGDGTLNFTPALVAGEQINATYTYYTGIVGEAQKIIDGDPADRANYPGYRAAGVSVQVLPPQVVVPPIAATVTVLSGYDVATVLANVAQALLATVNALPISGDVLIADLYHAATSTAGVANVVFSQPTSDQPILDNQIARTTLDNIVVS